MPIYAYVCPECGAEQDQFNRISERRTNAPHCHGAMDIKLSAVLGHVQRDCCYQCPVTDQPIGTPDPAIRGDLFSNTFIIRQQAFIG
jgi:putative FmdB family regulatory protein